MEPQTKSFKVFQASAGSGKTYTIVKEYLELCLRSQAATSNFSHILAITFTNMAANEMKDKIVRQLNSIIESDMSQPAQGMEADLLNDLPVERTELKNNAKILFHKILHDYSSFCVCTIDSFVQQLAKPFAKELRLPYQFTVSIDETEVADAITERIGEQIGEANPFLTKILEDYSGLKLDNEKSPKIEQNIHQFVIKLFSEEAYQKNERNQFMEPDQYRESVAFIQSRTKSFESQCEQFAEAFEDFLQHNDLSQDDFNGKSRSPILSLWKKIKDKSFASLTDTMLKLMSEDYTWYAKDLPKKRPGDIEDLKQKFHKLVIPFLRQYQANIGAYLFYRSQYNMLSLYVLRSKIRAEMEAYIGEEQLVHISEFNKRIHDVMDDFSVPFIYERVGEHFKHLFIDEFQDTSILQWQNLVPLLDNNLADQHMNMIVGDGKQSIYRWRNGEVGQIVSLPKIYSKPKDNPAFDQFESTLSSQFNFNELKCNYRSFQKVVDFNNAFFAFGAAEPYLDETARKVYADNDEHIGKTVSIAQECKHREQGMVQVELYDPDACDDTTIPSRILELIEELSERGFQKKDITVLVRENKQGSMIANYLTDKHIDVISSDSILLKSSNKVQLIIQSLDYLIHSDNAASIAAVLYYWHASHQEGFTGVIDHFLERAQSIAKGENSLEDEIGLAPKSLQSLLSKSYSLYDLCSALARLYGFNTIGDTYLNFLFDTVFTWQSAEQSSVEAFLNYWEKKSKKLSVVTGNTDAVNIMTIHKSKGLEFPVVIYPFANDNLDSKKTGSLWIAPEQLGLDPIPNIEKVQFSITKESAKWNAQTQRLAAQEQSKVRLDNMNINYVAFTRPVQRLYILSYQLEDDGKSPLNGFVKAHPEQQVDPASCPANSIVYRWGDPASPKVEQAHQPTSAKSVFHESRSSEWLDKISIDPDPSMFWISKNDQMKPQEWGDLVHQILSEIKHEQDINRTLKPYLDSGVIDRKTAQLLSDLFTKLVSHPVIGAAFQAEAKVKNECEILSKAYGILRPDRYAELPDRIYLLDYKTGKPSEKHHEQLQRYGSVLKKMVAKDIKAYLAYLGESLEVVPVELQ